MVINHLHFGVFHSNPRKNILYIKKLDFICKDSKGYKVNFYIICKNLRDAKFLARKFPICSVAGR